MELLERPSLYPQPPALADTDAQRIVAARCGLLAASEARGINHAIADEAVTALLTDLRHFCAARRIDFDRCVHLAAFHFEADREGGLS